MCLNLNILWGVGKGGGVLKRRKLPECHTSRTGFLVTPLIDNKITPFYISYKYCHKIVRILWNKFFVAACQLFRRNNFLVWVILQIPTWGPRILSTKLFQVHEFHETCHSVTSYFMKKDSKQCCDTSTPESIHTKDENKRCSVFAFIFGVKWPVLWMYWVKSRRFKISKANLRKTNKIYI